MTLRRRIEEERGPLLITAMAFVALLFMIWRGAFPAAIDYWGHLAKAEFLAESIRTNGIGELFSTTWFPSWYLGDAFRTYYPPLTTAVLTPFVLIFRDPAIIHKAFATIVLGVYAYGVYSFVRYLWGAWPAALGAVIAMWAPYQLRTLFFEGNYPRILALMALPLIALFMEQLLDPNRRKMPVVIKLALVWAWAILAHPQQAVIFAIGMAIYTVARLFLEAETPFAWGAWVLAGLVAGVALTAPWSLPAYSYGEQPHVPFLPLEKVEIFSAPLSALLPVWDSMQGGITVGVGALLLMLLCVVSRPERRRSAYAIAALAGIWLSFGPSGVFFSLLPMHNALMPERFLNFTSFAVAVAAAGLLPMRKRAVLVRSAVIALLLVVDVVPSIAILQGRPYPQREAALSVLAPVEEPAGRTLLLTYPEPSASEIYFAGEETMLVNGWALENTPHHRALRRYLGAAEWSPGYLAHLMGVWDVNQVAIRANGNEVALTEGLVAAGFKPYATIGEYAVWERETPQSLVQALPEDRFLVLGEGITHLLAAFPFAEEALEEHVLDLDPGTLAAYPAMAMSRFAAEDEAIGDVEALLMPYVDAGGTLIVDLSGMEEKFASSLDFLGTSVLRIQLNDSMRLRWDESLGDLPTTLTLAEADATAWSGAVYPELDEVLAEVELNGEWFPVLGYKDVGEGRVWFVGMNLLYYAQEAEWQGFFELAQSLFLEDVDLSRELVYEPVTLRSIEATGHGLVLDVDLEEPVEQALISYTYSPRWDLLVDGEPAAFTRFENLLLTSLPAGSYQVELVYNPFGTIYPVLGLIAGLLAMAVLAGGFFVERVRWQPPLDVGVTQEVGGDAHEYAVCANCSFRFAEVGPPTASTYPFQVVHCPICGLRMDDDGFEPGAALDDQTRAEALDNWLNDNRYNPEIVHERWGFSADEFFASGSDDEDVESFETPPETPFS